MSFATKVRFISVLFLLLFLLIALRLFYWQVVKGGEMTAAAQKQHFYVLPIPSERGEILARDGLPLAANREAFLLYAYFPKLPREKKTVAKSLAEVVAGDVPWIATVGAKITAEAQEAYYRDKRKEIEEELEKKLEISAPAWLNLAHFISPPTKKKIEELGIPGLGFQEEEQRDYPEASMAAHLLGFVGADQNGSPKGYFGLEGFYQRELSGKPGKLRLERDALGRPIAVGAETREDKLAGRHLVTTVDRAVQRFVESHLAKGISSWQASGGSAIVMDVATGGILAMASLPSYDPRYYPYYPTRLYKNPVIADLFEPGSIVKPIIMAAAIDEGRVAPETKCDRCSGPRDITGFYIRTFDGKYHPDTTMKETLVNSDNTGMVFVGEKLGFEKVYAALAAFGFGQKTGVDLEEEEEGKLRPRSEYYPIDRATITFGQGISVNALQVVRAFGVIANGGVLPTPHVVAQIKDRERVIGVATAGGEKVISQDAAKIVTEMLVEVTEKSPLSYPKERLPVLAKFRIAAKSGTAQIAVGGKYRESGTIASVVGFFPADKPRFVVFVKLVEPEVRPWGSDTSGPVFFAIVKDLVAYYGISP